MNSPIDIYYKSKNCSWCGSELPLCRLMQRNAELCRAKFRPLRDDQTAALGLSPHNCWCYNTITLWDERSNQSVQSISISAARFLGFPLSSRSGVISISKDRASEPGTISVFCSLGTSTCNISLGLADEGLWVITWRIRAMLALQLLQVGSHHQS